MLITEGKFVKGGVNQPTKLSPRPPDPKPQGVPGVTPPPR